MKKLILFLLIFSLGSLSAQSFIPKLMPSNSIKNLTANSTDTVRIFAVMVEFQPDDFDLTAGTGKFGTLYSKDYGTTILDPLPHNAGYFKEHLEFAKNYYHKVSGGNVELSFDVYPKVITVDKVMRDYFPPKDENFLNLADFSKEVWQKADSIFNGVNFSNYDLFVIFHAGTGGDVITPGSTGSEKDLPSIFLSNSLLKNLYGQNFKGFPVNSGNYFIKNSLILPETESREISGIGGTVLFQLTINGLIVSSIGSYLGLPDLFNTSDGSSAISRFGLMDGQAIFAFGGLFPPEPSAWEKIFLGWETPVVVKSNQNLIDIATRLSASFQDTTVIKVPINSDEYFLIENRNRDVNKNGANITYKVNGETLTKSFSKDEDDFIYFNVDAISGVVVDVDEYDWALPGSGIVIWHIDNNVIKEKLSLNKINADPDHRGVEVVEADGINDIGEKFTNFLGDVSEGEGTQEDFWYASNPSEFYENALTPNSKPSSKAHNGSNSLVNLTGFSDISNKMSFSLSFGSSNINLMNSGKLDLSGQPKTSKSYLYNSNGNTFILDNLNLMMFNKALQKTASIDSFSNVTPAIANLQSNDVLVGFTGKKINVVSFSDTAVLTTNFLTAENLSGIPVIISESADSLTFYAGSETGKLNKYSYNLNSNSVSLLQTNDFISGKPVKHIAIDGTYFIGASDFILNTSENLQTEFQEKIDKIILSKNKNNEYIAVVLSGGKKFSVIKKGKVINRFVIHDSVNTFTLANLFNDGENYIVFNGRDKIMAYNLVGSSALNFPVKLINENSFSGTPLGIDIDSDGKTELINFSGDGQINLVSSQTAQNIYPFPLSAGSKITSAGISKSSSGKGILSVLTDENYLINWELDYPLKIVSGTEYGNGFNNSFVDNHQTVNITKEFFPKNRTYNWPNPVYGNQTFIRTYVSEDALIDIKIFDLAGDFIDELKFNATGGFENEIAWDVSNIQSGAYLARVEAKGLNKSDYKIIKIAVVK